MPNCTAPLPLFSPLKRRQIELSFEGGDVTSDTGLLLLQRTDQHLNLLERIAPHLPDDRDPTRITHSTLSLLRQRVYGIAQGYEDLNDHDRLRHDPLLQTALGQLHCAGSSPTLCRFENRENRAAAMAIARELVEQFIAGFTAPPSELILDFDATDDPVHGNQENRFFHGYYGNYCFLPLYVFCGSQLLVAYLRPSNIDAAKHSAAILKLLVKRLRATWPGVRIIFRGDSGFCRQLLLNWCERNRVHYIVGLAKNSRLQHISRWSMASALEGWALTGEKQRCFGWYWYRAGSWKVMRHVIAKAEVTAQGENPRYVVTSLDGHPQTLYDEMYCLRGDMENRIKECQLGLFADRTSCHRWWPNQFRLLLASLAYVLIERLRTLALTGTELAHAQVNTLRVKLLKLGAVVVRNTRRIRILASSSFPFQDLFVLVLQRLHPG
jgi:Transposase DDE domain group 1